jgi:hypothetical protein
MQRLVFLNFATALLYMATVVAFLKCESVWLMLASTGLLALLAALALWSIGSIFTLWNRYKLRSFYPAAAFVLAVTLGFLGTRYAAHLMLAGTPCCPDDLIVSNQGEAHDTSTISEYNATTGAPVSCQRFARHDYRGKWTSRSRCFGK